MEQNPTRRTHVRRMLREYLPLTHKVAHLRHRLDCAMATQRARPLLSATRLSSRVNPRFVRHLERKLSDAATRLDLINSALQGMAAFPDQLELITQAYIQGERRGLTASQVNYSERQFYRMLGAALDCFADFYFEEKPAQ